MAGNGNGVPHVPNLTEEQEERLFNAIAVGAPIEQACLHAGISSSTYYRLRTAAKDATGGKLKEWWENLKRAQASCMVGCFEVVHSGAKGWQAKAWILERRFGMVKTERREDKVEHSGGLEITVKRQKVSEDDRRK